MKTIHTSHGGKLSISRVLCGKVSDAMELAVAGGGEAKVSGIYRMLGKDQQKITSARDGDTVALGKLDNARTGSTLTSGKGAVAPLFSVEPLRPVFSLALRPKERKDEVKLSTAIQRIVDEDPSLSIDHHQDTGETVLSGHGEMHLRVTIERLEGKYQIPVTSRAPGVPYRETIRKGTQQRGRHKKQSGGHGQFGDVVIEIKPLPRGSGFQFTDTVTGGAVPKQYIPSVEAGVRDFLKIGPLGFPVVDVAVNLSDGSYHTVDSSDMAFQMAAKIGMREGMPACSPVLLEPIMKVDILTPAEATAKVTAIVPQRRGQILGFDARPGWPGWDVVEATMPQSEIGNLIVELRSATAGVATYRATFDHMAELTGRLADEVINAKSKAA
jgi:elongation factor G